MKTPAQRTEEDRGGTRYLLNRIVLGLLCLMVTASFYCLYTVSRNVASLTQRTIPGISHAVGIIDLASRLEFSRQAGTAGSGAADGEETAAEFEKKLVERLEAYDGTILRAEDRRNFLEVMSNYKTYNQLVETGAGEPAIRHQYAKLTHSLHTMLEYRIGRLLGFTEDSGRNSRLAMLFNMVLLGLMFAGVAGLAIYYVLHRISRLRPEEY